MENKVFTGKNGDVFKNEFVCRVFGSSHFTLEDTKTNNKEEYEKFNYTGVGSKISNALDRLEKCMFLPFYIKSCNICTPSDPVTSNYTEIKVACTKIDYLNLMSSYAYTKGVYTDYLSIIAQNYVQWTVDLEEVIFLGNSEDKNKGTIAFPVKSKGLDNIPMSEYIANYDTIVPKKILNTLVNRIQELNSFAKMEMVDTDIVIITLRYYGPYNKALAYTEPSDDFRNETTNKRCSSFSKLVDEILDVYNCNDYLKIR